MSKQLQDDFYQDILDPGEAKNYLDSGGFTGRDLIQIYHNQYFDSLNEVLTKTYSCAQRLVGEDFFKFLTRDFIKNHPSTAPNIIDYGAGFSTFIAHHPHCQNILYLADVAKFEWLYERCYFSTNAVFFMHSDYPLIQIWLLDENSSQLDLSVGGDFIKIYKKNDDVVVEKITKKEYKKCTK